MKHITRAQGIVQLTLPGDTPDPMDLTSKQVRRRRGVTPTVEPVGEEVELVLNALEEYEGLEGTAQGFKLVDQFSLDLEPVDITPRRRGQARIANEMKVDVTLQPDEDVVMLIEQEGTYEWHFPEKTSVQRAPARRGRQGAVEQKKVMFRIPIGDGELPGVRRGAKRPARGRITNFIKGKIKGFILKFATRKVVGVITRRLEEGIEPGPVIITSESDAKSWRHEKDFRNVALPDNRPARVLLLIHGTFSSTIGSFGALTKHQAGRRFLDSALTHYDAILGHDHYTLSETPVQNAEALFEDLLELQHDSRGIEFDAVSFSRGGLIYRYLTEQIIPYESTSFSFRKSVFVGCTNAGTELANDENWKLLVDFYTNMVVGGARLIGLAAGAKLPAFIVSQSVKVIGSLVKYMAQDAIEDNGVPGLAAMEPESSFVLAINKPPVERTRQGARSYYAITSDFEPDGNTSAGKLGKRLTLRIADGLIDRLMGESNDLVVNTESMFQVDPLPSAMLQEVLPFGKNGEIYHTVYFHQPRLARQLSQWLGLIQAPRMQGGSPRNWWQGAVSDDFQVVPAETIAKDALRHIRDMDSNFIVIERHYGGERLHYGIPRLELEKVIRSSSSRNMDLIDTLGMRESHATDISLDDALSASSAQDLTNRPTSGSGGYAAVVVGDSGPVGVVATPEVLTADELAKDASRIQARSQRKKVTKKKSVAKKSAVRGGRRGAARGKPAMRGGVAPPVAKAPKVETAWCHVHALMVEEAVIGKKTPIEVTLSREEIIRTAGVDGKGRVDVEKEIIIQIVPRKHCVVAGESRVEMAVPAMGEEQLLYFDVIPKHEGVGEVDVIVRQGNRALVNLKLRPRFVTRASGGVVMQTSAEAEMLQPDSRRELPNVLYIRELQMGPQRMLEFQFECRKLNKRVRCTSMPFRDDTARKDYIMNLYQEIEEFWADDNLEYESFMAKLQARGSEIFDELIPRELQRVLWDTRDELMHIQVFSDEPFIPWELAYLKEPGKKARRDSVFLAEKGMVRWLPEAEQYPPTRLRLREGRVGYVIPSYPRGSRYQLPGAQQEREMLEDIFNAKPVTPSSINVSKVLEEQGKFDILHFACHGVADPNSVWNAGLLMKGKIKSGKYIEDKIFSSQIGAFSDLQEDDCPGPLVFLNACQVGRQGNSLTGTGGFAKAFIKSGAGAFVSTHWSVGDTSALEFSTTFYQKLLDGKNMMTSVAAARKAAKNSQEYTWLSYVVYADPYAKLVKE